MYSTKCLKEGFFRGGGGRGGGERGGEGVDRGQRREEEEWSPWIQDNNTSNRLIFNILYSRAPESEDEGTVADEYITEYIYWWR
jgi:hypothetical protein